MRRRDISACVWGILKSIPSRGMALLREKFVNPAFEQDEIGKLLGRKTTSKERFLDGSHATCNYWSTASAVRGGDLYILSERIRILYFPQKVGPKCIGIHFKAGFPLV